MTHSTRLDASLKRLAAAMDLLEAASDRRAVADRQRMDLEETLAVMQDDRSRLAVELDGAATRNRALDDATLEATRRLQIAETAIRAVLARSEPIGED